MKIKRILALIIICAIFFEATLLPVFSVTSEINPLSSDPLLFEITDGIVLDGDIEKAPDYTDKLDELTSSSSFTVLAQFMQTDGVASSIIGISNGQEHAHHFHIYVNADLIGYEFRIGSDFKISASSNAVRPYGINSVAFRADSENMSFDLYVNGALVNSQKFNEDTYKKLSDIGGLDSILVGATDRADGGNEYLFTGRIDHLAVYSDALETQRLIEYTYETKMNNISNVVEQPFPWVNDFGIYTFRIPCLITLQNGDLLAATDLRSDYADSPNNIETGVKILYKDTNTWSEPIIVNEFDDYEYNYPSKDSASFIDSALVQLENGRIFMLTDVMPAGGGGGVGGLGNGTVLVGDKYYIALTTGDMAAASNTFEYYLFPNPDAQNTYDKYLIKKLSDNSETGYSTDAKFYVYRDGEALTVKQKPNLEKDVPMNIFYSASDFKVYRTSYFYLNYSDDGGHTWSDPILVGSEYRTPNERYFNKSPGVGIEIKKGEYAGRILFPIYSGGQLVTRMLYSDDGGLTWSMGDRTPISTIDSPNQASETQVVELPDGTIRMYTRTASRYVGYADSLDGGHTFNAVRHDYDLYYCGDCMVSAINLTQKIDGKDAITVSYPEGDDTYKTRKNGVIKIGLITENEGYDAPAYGRYTIEWKYSLKVNNSSFWYSCLADKGDGTLAILYEPGPLVYDEFSFDYIIESSKKDENAPIINNVQVDSDAPLCENDEITVNISFEKEIYENYSDLKKAVIYAKAEGSSKLFTLKYSGISKDKTELSFTGNITKYKGEEITLILNYYKGNKIATIDGFINADSISNLSVSVAGHGDSTYGDAKSPIFIFDGHEPHTFCSECGEIIEKGDTIDAPFSLNDPTNCAVLYVAFAATALIIEQFK